jgi:anti-anti-sigma factor
LVEDHDGVSVVRVSGEIDLVTAPALEQAIGAVVADSPSALVIDLSAVEFLGSVGLKILAATYEKLATLTQFGVVADSPSALVIDLSAVEFLGSVGLKILAATYEKLATSTQFGVVAHGPATRRPIHLTGLDKTFPLYSTLDDALTGVGDGDGKG